MCSWVVLLEASAERDGEPMHAAYLRLLLEEMGYGVGLQSSDRWAVQLELMATNPAEALYTALSRWEQALARLELPRLKLVRSEVLTPDELEAEFDRDDLGAVLANIQVGEGGDCRAGLSDEEALARELLERAFTDPVTGLSCHDALRSQLKRAVERARGRETDHGLMCLSLEGFDAVVGSVGHIGADEVLAAVARRMVRGLRATDTAARVGPTDFAVLVEDVTSDVLVSIAERMVGIVGRPVVVGDEELSVRASVGATMVERCTDADVVMRRARCVHLAPQASGPSQAPGAHQDARSVGVRKQSHPPAPPMDRPSARDGFGYLLLLQEAAAIAAHATSVEDAAKEILRHVCRHTGWLVGHLWVASPSQPDAVETTGTWHVPRFARYESFRRATEDGPVLGTTSMPGTAAARREPVWVPDLAVDAQFARSGIAADCGLRAGVAVPVLVGDDVAAVLELFTNEPEPADGTLIEVLATVAHQLGRVLERSRAAAALRVSDDRLDAPAPDADAEGPSWGPTMTMSPEMR